MDRLPLDPNSQTFVETIGPDVGMHPDFGSGLYEGEPIGIPYVEVPADQAGVTVAFEYDDESDPGPYPIPADPPIEGGPNSDNDRHILIVQRDACLLFELYYAWPENDGTWRADSGAIFDLNSNQLRPETWTSADAAGLPILPGLVRYEEVSAGEIRHALRFTAPETQHAYVWPARHFASELTGQAYPPLGQRFRLRGDFDLSSFSPDVQIILRALQRYGMFLADNGSAWFLSGAPDERWDNDVLSELGQVQGSDFEAVDASSLMVDPDSAQAAGPTFEAGPLPPTSAPGAAGQGGHISYTLENNRVYLIAAEAGAQPEDVSQALDGLAEGADDGWLNLSPDGSWLALDTDRFDSECVGWTCLAILPADLSSGEAIRAGDELVHPEGKSAVASGGNLLVKPAGGGPHDRDLFVSTRSGGEWSATAALTEASPYAWNDLPAISDDGARIVFECGPQPYGAAGTAICEVGTDGSGFRVVLAPEQGPGGSAGNALRHPDYAPDGSLVFEADWSGQQIWRLPAGGGQPALVSPGFSNDNSPCVLPDGRIVSLWLERPGGNGLHEIKVMPPDGSSYEMILTGVDVHDVGIGCGA
ncbi:MAG TPA: hypothetical protein VGA59_12625 [Ramlibacter sp.]